jgi:hypothetical protein
VIKISNVKNSTLVECIEVVDEDVESDEVEDVDVDVEGVKVELGGAIIPIHVLVG